MITIYRHRGGFEDSGGGGIDLTGRGNRVDFQGKMRGGEGEIGWRERF